MDRVQISQVLKEVKNGNEEAFRTLINQFKTVAYIYIDRYCSLYPTMMDRKDLYQISLLSLYNSALNYDENMENTFSAYYSVLLERDILMHLRKQRTDKNRVNINAISLDRAIAETEGVYLIDAIANKNEEFDPKSKMEHVELYLQIEKCLDTFTKEEAEVFRMWMMGYSYKEIKERYQLNEKKVEYIIRKIRIQMREILEEWR